MQQDQLLVSTRISLAIVSLLGVFGMSRSYLKKPEQNFVFSRNLSPVNEDGEEDLKKSNVPEPSLLETLRMLFAILAQSSDANRTHAIRMLTIFISASVIARCSGELFIFNIVSRIDSLVREKKLRAISFFVLLGVPVVFVSQLVGLLQGKLSSLVRESLTQTLMTSLVYSPHNLCHPEELVDSDRLNALISDVNQTSVLAAQVGIERIRKWIEVLMIFILLRKSAISSAAVLAVYVGLTVSCVSGQKQLSQFLSKKVSESETVLKKNLSKLPRNRDAIALLHGGATEAGIVARQVCDIEAAKSVKDRFEFWNGLLAQLLSRVGGTALAAYLNQADGFAFLWHSRLLTQLGHSIGSLVEQTDQNKLGSMVRRLHASLIELPKQLPVEAVPFRVTNRKSGNICVSDVTVVSPIDGSSVLFQSLSFELAPGGALLVAAPASASSSALVRIVAGTWPPVMGEVSRPKTGVECVAPKPYLLTDASLKEQISYPDDISQFNEASFNAAIQVARISHLTDASNLSASDQQKLMIARLIYHKPKFALLDDCWRGLELDHLRQILIYLRNELGAGVLVACSTGAAAPLKTGEFGFPFDLELVLASPGKQPPRHQLIITPKK